MSGNISSNLQGAFERSGIGQFGARGLRELTGFGVPGRGGQGPGGGGNIDLSGLRGALEQYNPLFLNTGESLVQQGLAPGDDPLVAAQRAQALDATRGALSRRGVTGSVALNQLGRVNQQYDQAALGRKDALLQGGFGLLGGGLQNLTADPTLQISALAARNAGQDQGGKSGLFK